MKKYLKALIVLLVIGVLSITASYSVVALSDGPKAYAVATGSTLTFYYNEVIDKPDGTVWKVENGSNATLKWGTSKTDIKEVIFDDSFASYTELEKIDHWFYEFKNLTTVTNLTNLNTASVTEINRMFMGCSSLTSLDVSSFNTASVIDMSAIFEECKSLKELDLSNWKTSSVMAMSCMFSQCYSLATITGLNNWDTSNVMTMDAMFAECYSLKESDLSSWNTLNVIDMSGMFTGCSSLKELNLSSWNTASVTSMFGMFGDCASLTTIYASETFVTTKITEPGYGSDMFAGCNLLIGGNGTSYASMYLSNQASATDITYAKIDQEGQLGYFTLYVDKTEDESEEVNPYWNWYRKNNKVLNISTTTEIKSEDTGNINKKNEAVTTDIPTLTYDVVTVTNGAGTSNPVVSDNAGASSSLIKDTMPVYFLILGATFIGLIATLVLRVSLKK